MFKQFLYPEQALRDKHPLWVFGGFLILLNALLIGLYFSGISWMQEIIAPTIDGLNFSQWREFGLMENIQNLLLLLIIAVFTHALFTKPGMLNKAFYGLGLAVFIFLFLEEIDYGLHHIEWLTGETPAGIEQRNWHNQWNDGVENATRLKKVNDAANILWFLLLPLLTFNQSIRRSLSRFPLIPSRWFILSVLIAVAGSKVAHYLDDNGFAVINGYHGNLHKTIAEFRETSVYYVYLLYALQCVRLKHLITPATDYAGQ